MKEIFGAVITGLCVFLGGWLLVWVIFRINGLVWPQGALIPCTAAVIGAVVGSDYFLVKKLRR